MTLRIDREKRERGGGEGTKMIRVKEIPKNNLGERKEQK